MTSLKLELYLIFNKMFLFDVKITNNFFSKILNAYILYYIYVYTIKRINSILIIFYSRYLHKICVNLIIQITVLTLLNLRGVHLMMVAFAH